MRPQLFSIGLCLAFINMSTVRAAPSVSGVGAVFEAGSSGEEIRSVLASEGWIPLDGASAQYETGQLWSSERRMMVDCVDATPTTVPATLSESKGSSGFIVEGRAGALVASGAAGIQADFFKIQKVTDSSTSVIDGFDMVLTQKCHDRLLEQKARGVDVDSWWVISETFNATVTERSCKGKAAEAKVRVMMAKGEIAGESSCEEETIDVGVIAYRAMGVAELLSQPARPSPRAPASEDERTIIESGSVQAQVQTGFGDQPVNLGIDDLLRQQRCDEEATQRSIDVREAKISDAVASAQAEARSALVGLERDLVGCAQLDVSRRGPCVQALTSWIATARELKIVIDAGVERVETSCGFRDAAFSSATRVVEASVLPQAEALLAQLTRAEGCGEVTPKIEGFGRVSMGDIDGRFRTNPAIVSCVQEWVSRKSLPGWRLLLSLRFSVSRDGRVQCAQVLGEGDALIDEALKSCVLDATYQMRFEVSGEGVTLEYPLQFSGR